MQMPNVNKWFADHGKPPTSAPPLAPYALSLSQALCEKGGHKLIKRLDMQKPIGARLVCVRLKKQHTKVVITARCRALAWKPGDAYWCCYRHVCLVVIIKHHSQSRLCVKVEAQRGTRLRPLLIGLWIWEETSVIITQPAVHQVCTSKSEIHKELHYCSLFGLWSRRLFCPRCVSFFLYRSRQKLAQ